MPNAAEPPSNSAFKVRITNSGAELKFTPSRCARRCRSSRYAARYAAAEQEHLKDLFGEPERWSKTLHSLLWTNANVNVPAFTSSTLVEVPVPCTFDFQVAITKYIYGLEGGELPVSLMFSGTIFYAG